LLHYPAELSEAEFGLTETGVQWEIDLSATGKLTEKPVGKAEQYDLDLVDTGWTETELCRWLERKVRQIDTTQTEMLEFVRRAVAHLIEKRGLPLTVLVRWRFILAKVLIGKIGQYRERASRACYQQTLFGPQAAVETGFAFEFGFTPGGYAPHWRYEGHPYQFQKHYYAAVGELDNKGEEYECAKALDLTYNQTLGPKP
jgi:type III restriction enzyme